MSGRCRRWWFKRKLIRRARRMGWLDAIPQEWHGREMTDE